jgi:succinyl-CoA synthetase alpha subunit
VTPGRGGSKVPGTELPVFDTVKEAMDATGATASVVFVPPYLVLDAASEAVDAGISLLVVITEGMPPQDTAKLVAQAKARGVKMIGPNCPGIITPTEALLGILPGSIFKKGPVGMVSKSGTLTYEIALSLSDANLGQSTCVGVGGDPVKGMEYPEVLTLFENDPETEVIVLIGEIGGTAEEEAAEFIKQNIKKPVIGYIAGQTAPPGKRMGHAGAIISGGKGTAESKMKAMKAAGIEVALTPREVAEKAAVLLKQPVKK